jgi:superfamily II DNA or RNA helicase
MKPSELTKAGLMKWGGEAVYHQAEALVKRGGVLKAEMKDDGWITGIIARETGEVHTKLRVLTPERIDSHCPCFTNRHSGQVCMHVVALGINLMMRYTDPLRQQKYVEDQRRAKRMEQLDAVTIVRGPRGTPARLALTLPPTWLELFRAGHVPLNLLLLTEREVLMPEQLPRDRVFALSDADDNLLGVLEDICEGPPKNTNDMAAIDFLNVLAVASHTRIAVAGKTELSIHPVAVETHLRVNVNETTGELTVFPEATLPFTLDTEPTWLVSNHTGWMLIEDELYPIKNVLPIPYHGIYASREIIPRKEVMNFLKRSLPSLKTVIPIEMSLTPDLFVEIPGNPHFRLELKGSRASLSAQLKAVYGEQSLVAGVPYAQTEFAMPDPEDILTYRTRNLAAEKNAVTMLLAQGFETDSDSAADASYSMAGVRETLNFLGTGYQTLGRFGWKIEFSPRLLEIVESMPAITPVVQISEKRNGWFDVGFTFELPGRGAFPAADIQRAINRGDAWLESNGETVLIDRDAVESMRGIFSDCRSRPGETAGHFEMSPIYAPFVQSSLQEIDGVDVEDPPDWRDQAAARNRSGSTRLRPVPLGVLENILRPYQKEGVYWLRFIEESGLNGILADEMGLGKTLQTLTWLSLPRVDVKAQKKPALIVCPTSLVENWNREAEQFVPHLKRLVISGSDRAELFSKIHEQDIVITSYALLRRDLEQYEAFQFSVAVLDEAQHIKNRSTQNAVAAKQINAINRLVLTGTPVENSVADLWSIMDYLMPQYLGEYENFRYDYEQPISEGDRTGELAQKKLRRKLNPFLLRRLKKDVAKDLPDKIIKVSFCTLTPDQQRVYNQMLNDCRRTIDGLVKTKGFDRSRFEILAILMRLRQICCHLDLLKDHHKPGTYEAPSAKMDAFFELLDEAVDGGHRILVFSQFVTMLKVLRDEFEKRGIQYCYLDGSTQDRLAQCQRFNQTPSIPVFLISLKAGGTGLNLTGADMVVHFDPWWNPAVEDQATDRAHRIGQKRTVYSIKLIAEHTVEEKVLAMQQRKQAIINATIGVTDESVMSKLTFDDIKDLIGL